MKTNIHITVDFVIYLVGEVYILFFNSYIKFCAKICMHC